MSWTRYLLHDFWTAQEFNRMEDQMARRRRARQRRNQKINQELDALEDDTGRLALFMRTLVDLCLEKGVFTEPELSTKLAEIDLLDGTADGKLNPDDL